MRVSFLTSTVEACGIAAYSRSLSSCLARSVELDIVSTWQQSQPWEEYINQSIGRLNASDVAHIQHEYSFWGSILPKRGAFSGRFLDYTSRIKVPIVLTAHTLDTLHEMFGLDKPGSGIRRFAKRILANVPNYRNIIESATFNVADRIILHDQPSFDRLVKRGIDGSRICIIPMGVPEAELRPELADGFRDKYNLHGRRLIVIFGFTRPGRGYETALDVLAKSPADVSLVIAGGPQTDAQKVYLEQLSAVIDARGLRDRVVVTGYLPDESVPGVMQAADIVLCSQESGTGSYSVQVALGYGRPILASDLPCFKYMEESSGCLVTFKRGGMAAGINTLLNDESLRHNLSARAIGYAREHTWEKIAARTTEVYRELVP